MQTIKCVEVGTFLGKLQKLTVNVDMSLQKRTRIYESMEGGSVEVVRVCGPEIIDVKGGKVVIDRFICASDIHIREKPYPNDLQLGIQLLEDLRLLAVREKSKHIVIPGDLFHSKSPSFNVLISVYNKLEEIRKSGITTIVLRGNHDIQIKSQAEKSILQLFSRVCLAVTKPYMIENKHQMLIFLPWYPGPKFRQILKHYHKLAAGTSKQKIIFGHIGVTEGEVSENYRINQEVGTKDFATDLYDLVVLGDYHRHQWVTDKVVYLGCPISLNFGDNAPRYSPWLLNMRPSAELVPLQLPSIYPKYKVYELNEAKVIPGYDHKHRNRIKCPVDVAEKVSILYPDAEIEYTGTQTSYATDRLDGIRSEDWKTVWKEFCALKGWGQDEEKTGLKYLRQGGGK